MPNFSLLSFLAGLQWFTLFNNRTIYNKLIKKQKLKLLKNIDRLIELPFYEQLDVIETDQALSIKNLFSDLLNETKGFKYQITAKVLLKKYKLDGENEFRPVYFNSFTNTVTNHRFKLESSFQEF